MDPCSLALRAEEASRGGATSLCHDSATFTLLLLRRLPSTSHCPSPTSISQRSYSETLEELDSAALRHGLQLGPAPPPPSASPAEDLLRLLPCPAFRWGAEGLEAWEPSGPALPACANLVRPSVAVLSERGLLFVVARQRQSLWGLVTFNAALFLGSETRLHLALCQLLAALRHCAALGLRFPRLGPECFAVQSNLWLRLNLPALLQSEEANFDVDEGGGKSLPPAISDTLTACNLEEWRLWLGRSLEEATSGWRDGRLSNLDYLLLLNAFAGREWDEREPVQAERHPILPWVVDFSLAEGGWRDLSRTKYRLCKGDRQLRESWEHCVEGQPRYHVPELLSELAFLLYRARREPQARLRRVVRAQWVPEEYPASVRRLFASTPDEAIPEFYARPDLFRSLHPDMGDLGLPEWTASPEAFVRWHRGMLECDWVSGRLHHWIDLVFGHKLSGPAAEDALNVQLSLVEAPNSAAPRAHGPVQLFTTPHPAKAAQDTSPSGMDEAFTAVLNPLYSLAQRPADAFPVAEEPTDLVSLSAEIGARGSTEENRDDARAFFILALQLVFPQAFRHLPAYASRAQREDAAKRLLSAPTEPLPRCLRPLVPLLFPALAAAGTETRPSYLAPLRDWLEPLVSPLPFPNTIPPLHEILAEVKSSTEKNEAVRSLGKWLGSWTELLSEGEVEAVAEVAASLAEEPESAASALWGLFPVLAPRLRRRRLRQLFDRALRLAWDPKRPATQRHLKLYHRSFLLHILVRLGTRRFLRDYLSLIVQTALGQRDERVMEEEDFAQAVRTAYDETRAVKESEEDDGDSQADSQDYAAEDILGRLELGEEAGGGSALGVGDVSYTPSVVEDEQEEATAEEGSSSTASLPVELSEGPPRGAVGLGEVARESLVWLAERLGPTLATECVAGEVLEALWQADDGPAWDQARDAATDVLKDLAGLYGDAVVLLHYVPVAVEGMRRCSGARFGQREERLALGALTLLHTFFPYFSDKQLMDNLQEVLVDAILFPAVRLVSSLKLRWKFPQRRSEAVRLSLELLHGIGSRVGAENVKRYMAAPLQRLLCTYDALFKLLPSGQVVFRGTESSGGAEPPAGEQLRSIFTPILAARIQRLFSALCGRRYFALSLPNADLLAKLVEMGQWSAQEMAEKATLDGPSTPLQLASSPFNHLSPAAQSPGAEELRSRLPRSERTLRGAWLGHWERELARRGRQAEPLALGQTRLLALHGHSGPVRHLVPLDNENSLASAAADKTVRLWSLRSEGDGAAQRDAQWVYRGHRKAIIGMGLLPGLRLWLSADPSSVQVWDPFLGSKVCEVEVERGVEAVGLGLASAAAAWALVPVSEGTLRLLDVRQGGWAAEMKLAGQPIRGIFSREERVGLAHPGGLVSLLDLRTGRVLSSKKHLEVGEVEPALVEAVDDGTFAYCSSDGVVSLCSLSDLSLLSRLPGSLDGVHSLVPGPTEGRGGGAGAGGGGGRRDLCVLLL